jgi:hypothetical protein
MLCPQEQGGALMLMQTSALNGCTPTAFPFAADGTFIVGPWAAS